MNREWVVLLCLLSFVCVSFSVSVSGEKRVESKEKREESFD
jgi:hypothetical protein